MGKGNVAVKCEDKAEIRKKVKKFVIVFNVSSMIYADACIGVYGQNKTYRLLPQHVSQHIMSFIENLSKPRSRTPLLWTTVKAPCEIVEVLKDVSRHPKWNHRINKTLKAIDQKHNSERFALPAPPVPPVPPASSITKPKPKPKQNGTIHIDIVAKDNTVTRAAYNQELVSTRRKKDRADKRKRKNNRRVTSQRVKKDRATKQTEQGRWTDWENESAEYIDDDLYPHYWPFWMGLFHYGY